MRKSILIRAVIICVAMLLTVIIDYDTGNRRIDSEMGYQNFRLDSGLSNKSYSAKFGNGTHELMTH